MITINPSTQRGSMANGITGLPIIIGLPSSQAPIPNFAIGVTTEENARTSMSMPGLPLSTGDLFMKSARNNGEYSFKIALSENPNVKSEQIKKISMLLQKISTVVSAFMTFGGAGVLPGLGGITTNFAISQLNALHAMKDGAQPLMVLNFYMPLETFSINNPFLYSLWYIVGIDSPKLEAEGGMVVTVTLREQLVPRTLTLAVYNIVKNLANEFLGRSVGSKVKGIL